MKMYSLNIIFAIIFSVSCVFQEKSNSSLDDEITDLKIFVENYGNDLNSMESTYKKYKDLIDIYAANNSSNPLLEDLNKKNKILSSSRKNYAKIYSFYENITDEFEKDSTSNANVFKNYKKAMRIRKESGVSEMNRLLHNFLFPNKTKIILERIIEILVKNDDKRNDNIKLRKSQSFLKENTEQFSAMRIWSSFRLEETLIKSFEKDANNTELIKALLAGFYASIPSSYCWVHESNLGTFQISVPDSKEIKKITNLVYNTTSNFEAEEKGGLFIEKCRPGDEDCTFFCSTTNCESPEDFYTRRFENINYVTKHPCKPNYDKKGNLCYPVCEKIGMVTCEVGICSFSKEGCDLKQPEMSEKLVESFVDFLGHIFSLKTRTPFGWSNPESLKIDLKVFEKYEDINSKRLAAFKPIIKNYRYFRFFYENFRSNTFNIFKVSPDKENYSNFFDNNFRVFKFLFTDQIDNYNPESYLNNLSSCDLKFWDKDLLNNNSTDLTPNELRKKQIQKNCFTGLGSLLKNLKPYMLLGFASDFTKPLCPFAQLNDE